MWFWHERVPILWAGCWMSVGWEGKIDEGVA